DRLLRPAHGSALVVYPHQPDGPDFLLALDRLDGVGGEEWNAARGERLLEPRATADRGRDVDDPGELDPPPEREPCGLEPQRARACPGPGARPVGPPGPGTAS